MLGQIICISILLSLLQFFFYKKKVHKLIFYILPTIMICYMIFVIFHTVREQALINTSFPLSLKVLGMLLPCMISLILMIICIVKKYQHLQKRGAIRFIVLRQFIGFLCVMFIILSVTVYIAQEYVIFFPNKSEQDSQTLTHQQKFKAITIQNQYKGWLKSDEQDDTIIVYFGGNAQNTASTFLEFDELGIFDSMEHISFLSIDYPSYGESTGSLSQASIFQMADDVIKYVKETFPDKKIDIIGYSIGTGIASYVAANNPPDKFVLIAPYNNGQDLFNTYFPIFYGPLTYLIRYPLSSDAYVKQISCDTLILSSTADSIVPIQLTQKLIESFDEEPNTIVYEKESHADLITEVKPWKDIIHFLKQ